MIENDIKNLRRQKIMAVALLTIPACASVISCGPKGPEGPPGPAGPAGGGSGSSLPACSDIIAQGTCFAPFGMTLNAASYPASPYNLSIMCSASGAIGSEAFQVCYYTDPTCPTNCATGSPGFGFNFLPDTAGGGLNFIGQNSGGTGVGGPFAQIISATGTCPQPMGSCVPGGE